MASEETGRLRAVLFGDAEPCAERRVRRRFPEHVSQRRVQVDGLATFGARHVCEGAGSIQRHIGGARILNGFGAATPVFERCRHVTLV